MAEQFPTPTPGAQDDTALTPPPPTQEPLLPPSALVIALVAGLVVAGAALLIQGSVTVFVVAGLAVSVLALLLLLVVAPQTIGNALAGRTLRFGGTSLLVTLVVLAALIAIYVLAASFDIRTDLTQANTFSLNPESRNTVQVLAADPTSPRVEIIGFYDTALRDRQDQDELLLRQYAEASGGRISYRFVDPERTPGALQTYSAQRGQLVVVPLDEAGAPIVDRARPVGGQFSFVQNDLTNAIVAASAGGDFRAVILSAEDTPATDDSGAEGLSAFADDLRDRLGWTVEQRSILQLASPNATEEDNPLRATGADGTLLIIVGGTRTLPDEAVAFITEYLDGGGNLLLFAAPSVARPALASTEGLNDYLAANYALRVDEAVVLDDRQAFQSVQLPVVRDLSAESIITQAFAGRDVLFPIPRVLDVSVEVPTNVSRTVLARTSEFSYAKPADVAFSSDDLSRAPSDAAGPFAVAVASENILTGSRAVVFGSSLLPVNQFAQFGTVDMATVAAVWATRFDAFFEQLPLTDPFAFRPQDAPVFADQGQLRTISFITIFALPFGVLLVGLATWWVRRSRTPGLA